jgi:hypothetical protein
MISITGYTQHSFIFPANRPTAFEFYSDWRRTLGYLTYISYQNQSNNQHFRMLYSTTELGIYQVQLYCDVITRLDRDTWTILIQPQEEIESMICQAGLHSMKAMGYYSSLSSFHEQGERTRIDYQLNLHAELPVPYAIRFMPASILQNVARGIMQRRIEEIVEKFIQRSIEAYQLQVKT